MTKFLFAGAFFIGAIAIIWIGGIFLGADALGLGVTVLIAAVYAIGASELVVFRRATGTLRKALMQLEQPQNELEPWLSKLDTSLQSSVRARVEGAHNGLPAPVITPYLVGLLVMLGLLGTFVGMVDTLKGAVVALEGSSELEAIRAGLAAPIEGLGLAFGTSVAGVAASAMLGLLSTICRRERLQTSRLLDHKVSKELSQFSTSYQQNLAFKAIQNQAEALPAVAEQLTSLAGSLEQMGGQLATQLLDNQIQFQGKMTELYGELNSSVDKSLKTTLVDSAELIGTRIQPLAEEALARITESAECTQEQLNKTTADQLNVIGDALQGISSETQTAIEANTVRYEALSTQLAEHIKTSTDASVQALADRTQAVLETLADTSTEWAQQQTAQGQQFTDAIKQELIGLREDEAQRGDAAVATLNQLQSAMASQLAELGQALEQPMTRLIETASKTPEAAADVIEQLRTQMSKNLQHDNELLAERANLIKQLDGLAGTLEASSVGQREAIDTLVQSSTDALGQVSEQFGQHIAEESGKLSDVAEHFATSSAEMASLSEAFNAAVTLFNDSNNQLIENLTRIEGSLEQSSSRSDEQLAYYVAQAREIIDHNLLSHQQIIAALHSQKPEQLAVDGVGS